VLADHSIRKEEQQLEITERIRSAQLLTWDDALITPAAMAGVHGRRSLAHTQKRNRLLLGNKFGYLFRQDICQVTCELDRFLVVLESLCRSR
jgi:hypothetical protein